LVKRKFALAEPVPFTFANLTTKLLTLEIEIYFPTFLVL
jgi:hypothetical protein